MAGPFPLKPDMFGSRPPSYSPFGGQPDGMTAAIMAMLLPMLQTQMGAAGLVPSQMMPQQNLYDQMQGQQFSAGQLRAMEYGAKRDAETYKEFFSGAYTAMGFDPTAHKAPGHIKTLSDDVAYLAPYLAMSMPEDFDAMHGRRGSALVLSQAMHRAGRHQVDPTTGGSGMRADTAGRMAAEIFDTTYGPGATLEAMRGVSAGGAGMLYEDMLHRGLLDPSVGLMSRTEQEREVRGLKLGTADYDRIAKRVSKETGKTFAASEVQHAHAFGTAGAGRQELTDDMLTTVDAAKVKGRLTDMTAAVSAMRDIFGDAGNANAPMAELMQALDQLTQGGLSSKSPGQLEQLVRKTNYLAKAAGVSMDVVMGLTAQGGGIADRFGLDRAFVPQMLQSTLAFGGAATHAGLFSTPAWGASDKEKLTLMYQQLGLSAAASPNANRIGALIRMNDRDLFDKTATPAGKRLAALAAAAKSGDAKTMAGSEVTDDVEFGRLAREAGINSFTFHSLLNAREANQEPSNQYNIGKLTQNMQFETDITPVIQAAFGGQLMASLQTAGVPDSGVLANKIGNRVAEGLLKSDPKERGDPAKRNAMITKLLQDATRVELHKAGATPAQIADVSADRQMRKAAEAGWSDFDRSQRTYYRSAEDTLRLNNPDVLAGMGKLEREAIIDGQTSSALAGAGSAGPLRNFVDAIREAKNDTGLDTIVYKTLGGFDQKYANANKTNVIPITAAYMAAKQLLATAPVNAAGATTAAGVAQQQRANKILEALTTGKITTEQIKDFANGDATLQAGLEQARLHHGFGGALKTIGIDVNAAPASFLSDKQLMDVMPADMVRDKLAELAGGATPAIQDVLNDVFSGGREVQGARAIRSRTELLDLARKQKLVKGTGLAAERAGIEALLKDESLNAEDKETVRRNKHDYSLIEDLGTDAVDSAQEIREKIGARAGERQGTMKVTGTVEMISLDKAMLCLTTGSDLGTAASSPPRQTA